jgi:hypothetical protein
LTHNKVHPSTYGLCSSCTNSTIREQGTRVTIDCSTDGHLVPIRRLITACSAYRHANVPSEWELAKIAWTITADKHGHVKGFQPPTKKDD